LKTTQIQCLRKTESNSGNYALKSDDVPKNQKSQYPGVVAVKSNKGEKPNTEKTRDLLFLVEETPQSI
jgi:hypothetical protein